MMLSRRVFLSLFFRWMMYVYIVSIIPTLTENATRVAMKIVCVVVVFLPFSKTSKKQRKGKKESSFCGKGVRFEEEPKREERRPQRRKRKTFLKKLTFSFPILTSKSPNARRRLHKKKLLRNNNRSNVERKE